MVKIGIADTMFARYDMAKAVIEIFEQYTGMVSYERYTVPGIKDLPVACLKLFEEKQCDLVMALGMPGPKSYDKMSAQVASQSLVQVQLMTRKHILEVFVHEDEGKDEHDLAQLMHKRARDHAINAVNLLLFPQKIQEQAGKGVRQGRESVGSVR